MNTANEMQALIEELMNTEIDFDEVELLCGCTGTSCQSGWII